MPPKTRSAGLEVLANLKGVKTHNATVRGCPAVEVTYRQFWKDLIDKHTVVLGRATARVIAKHESNPGGTYDVSTTSVEAVNQIPGSVQQKF